MLINEQPAPLALRTTLGIGGPARAWAEINSAAEVPEALAWARKGNLPWTVLGSGSNVLVSDAGYPGLVLHFAGRGIEFLDGGLVRVDAGAEWDGFVAECVARGWGGVEYLSGIPGTVGATPIQNVGAYGQEVADTLERVHAWDACAGAAVVVPAAECGFGYRTSRFNQADAGRFLITAVEFRLQRADPAALLRTREETRATRRAKGMLLEGDAPESRSAGSFFKNPVLSRESVRTIERAAAAAPPQFAQSDGRIKIPAAWLIERAGFSKGFRLPNSGVGLSRLHVLAIVNYDHGTAAQVLALADHIRAAVSARFGVSLCREPALLGPG